MPRNDIGFYKTNSNSIPAVVLADRATRDATSGAVTGGDVDVLLLGVDQGKRYNVPAVNSEVNALPNQFAFNA